MIRKKEDTLRGAGWVYIEATGRWVHPDIPRVEISGAEEFWRAYYSLKSFVCEGQTPFEALRKLSYQMTEVRDEISETLSELGSNWFESELGRAARERRKRLRINLGDAAYALGPTPAQLSDFELGRSIKFDELREKVFSWLSGEEEWKND